MTRKKTGKGLVAGGTPRVNMLPPQEVENRGRQSLRMQWLKAFITAIVLVALALMIGFQWNFLAHADLDATAQNSVQLQSQLAQYSEVVNLQADVQNLQDLRTKAGSNDLSWGPLIAEIRAVLPNGVGLIGFKLVPGAAPTPGTDVHAQVGLRGTLTFSAKKTSAQAETIMRLRTVNGFIDVDASELSSDGPAGGFTFVTTFTADQTRYSMRSMQTGGR